MGLIGCICGNLQSEEAYLVQPGDKVICRVAKLKIRTNPSIESGKVIGSLTKGEVADLIPGEYVQDPVALDGQLASWYHIQLQSGPDGWVFGAYVQMEQAKTPCNTSDIPELKSIIKAGANVNKVCPNGATPLQGLTAMPFSEKNIEIAELLIENGADVNMGTCCVPGEGGECWSYPLASYRSVRMAKVILKGKPNMEVINCALTHSIYNEDIEMTTTLLEAGANPDHICDFVGPSAGEPCIQAIDRIFGASSSVAQFARSKRPAITK